jgi:tetratricopeptide (TPR) repeat protein
LRSSYQRAVAPSRWYELRKWLGRHRAPALAGTAAAILILAASGFAWRSAVVARREKAAAEQRFNDVRRLARKVLIDYPDTLWRINAATDLQVRMATDSLEYLDSLARARSSDPQVQLELVDGYTRVGRLLGTRNFGTLGNWPKALETFQKARAIIDDLLRSRPGWRPARMKLGVLLYEWGAADPRNARDLARQNIKLWEDLNRESPEDICLRELARSQVLLAQQSYDLEEARRAVEISEAWLACATDKGYALTIASLAHRRLAWAWLQQRNDPDAAMAAARKAEAEDEQARSLMKSAAAYRMNTAMDLQLIARSHLRARHYAQARDVFRRCRETLRSVFEGNRRDAWVQGQLLAALSWEGWSAELQGDLAAARAIYGEAVSLAPTLTAAEANNSWKSTFGSIYGSQGLMVQRAGRRTEACALFARAAAYFHAGGRPDPELGRPGEIERQISACRGEASRLSLPDSPSGSAR